MDTSSINVTIDTPITTASAAGAAVPLNEVVEIAPKQEATSIIGRHIPALDGIRGTAIILVIFFHLVQSVQFEFSFDNPLIRPILLGWTGVDLFFVLSGFLITGILFDQKGKEHYFKNFYMRRALRIFPLYFGALLAITLLRVVWPGGGQQIYGTENPAWMWVYLTNFVIPVQGAGSFGVLDHFWSLAIEEHFYFVWPFVVYTFNRQQLIRIAVVVAVTSLVLRIILVLAGADTHAAYMFTPARLDALCMGALLALLARGPQGLQKMVLPAKIIAAVTAVSLVTMLVSRRTYQFHDEVVQTVGFSLIALFFAAILILGITSSLQRIFNLGILRWFGKYSYGLYVFHPIVFVLLLHTERVRTLRGGSGIAEMLISVAVALTVTVLITLLSWNLWESQFLKLKRYFEH